MEEYFNISRLAGECNNLIQDIEYQENLIAKVKEEMGEYINAYISFGNDRITIPVSKADVLRILNDILQEDKVELTSKRATLISAAEQLKRNEH